MSEHRAHIHWENTGGGMDYEQFSRDHTISVKAGRVRIPASSAPAYKGSDAALDPEDALVAALASCHMLTFLAIAARRRLEVSGYEDEAVGILEPDEAGRLAVTRVTLRPRVRFAPGTVVASDELVRLHDKAHANCFIANSVRAAVRIEPTAGEDRPGASS